MKGNFKTTAAIALLDSTKVAAPAVAKFGDTVADQFAEIARTEKMNACRAILIGIALPILKNSMERGQFRPWLEANVTRSNNWTKATAIKNASYFTRLAHRFIEDAKVSGDQLLAITDGKTFHGEAGSNKQAAELLAKIADFVGESSIAELLADHGIKNGGSSAGSGKVIEIPASSEDPLFADTAAHLIGLREIVLNPDTLKRFTAKQLEDIERQIASLPEEFRKLKKKLRE